MRNVIICCILLCAACSSPQQSADRKPVVFTSIVTHKYFAERIAGPRLAIYALAGVGTDPHSFTPTPSQMAALSRAVLFARAGVAYENGVVPKLERMRSDIRIVDLRNGISLENGIHAEEPDHHEDGDHDRNHNHHHQKGDPHVWLSPVLARTQVKTLRDAFIALDPSGRTEYERNADSLLLALDRLHAHMTESLKEIKGSDLFVYHPAFTYFAHAYGLHQVAVETGGKEPGAKTLSRLIERIREHKVNTIFVQPQFSERSARALAAQTGIAVVPVDPLPADYFTQMYRLAVSIRNGIQGAPVP